MIINKLISRIQLLPKDFFLFLLATTFFCFAQGIYDSTFNNFLKETFSLTDFQRSILEVPREMPGFLVVFVSALLFFLCSRRLASLANFIVAVAIVLIAFFSISFDFMLFFLFIFSIGQHLFLPLNSSIGMELANEGKAGKRLGQISGTGNIFAILGSLFVFIGFNFFKFNFKIVFLVCSIGFLAASIFIYMMSKNKKTPAKDKLKLRKEYKLFYWLCILYGTRKQIFLTFAPWVLVKIYEQETQTVALLLVIAGVIGIFFKPLLGRAIDHLGEKIILAAEAAVLIVVCIGYGFSKFIFPGTIALFILFACYITDYLLMSVGMARATYIKKIALKEEDISQTLTMGVTIDHIFSISIAVISGLIWKFFGFQYVFLLASIIALVNFFSALKIKIPEKSNLMQN
jgi:predicted MFS family arabinose efflux permease